MGQARWKILVSVIVGKLWVVRAVLWRVRIRREVEEVALGKIRRLICAAGALLRIYRDGWCICVFQQVIHDLARFHRHLLGGPWTLLNPWHKVACLVSDIKLAQGVYCFLDILIFLAMVSFWAILSSWWDNFCGFTFWWRHAKVSQIAEFSHSFWNHEIILYILIGATLASDLSSIVTLLRDWKPGCRVDAWQMRRAFLQAPPTFGTVCWGSRLAVLGWACLVSALIAFRGQPLVLICGLVIADGAFHLISDAASGNWLGEAGLDGSHLKDAATRSLLWTMAQGCLWQVLDWQSLADATGHEHICTVCLQDNDVLPFDELVGHLPLGPGRRGPVSGSGEFLLGMYLGGHTADAFLDSG